MRTVVASRCVLEPQVAAHAPEMFRVLSDPALYEFENAPPPSEAWLLERYRRLESRGPDAEVETWLNWVVRLPDGALAGYVQATVIDARSACVAYELNSRYWRRGIGSAAVGAMLGELHAFHGIDFFVAIWKARNFRSAGLLRKLGFVEADAERTAAHRDEPDEVVHVMAMGMRNP